MHCHWRKRTVLDTLVLGDLHKLTDRIDTLSGTSPGEAELPR